MAELALLNGERLVKLCGVPDEGEIVSPKKQRLAGTSTTDLASGNLVTRRRIRQEDGLLHAIFRAGGY
ncbi:MAG: hypothetical protein WA738_06345 [Candidatus Angelobacter sp.]